MDFAIDTMDLAAAADEPCDALVVLLPQDFEPGADALSKLARDARAAGDLEFKPGKLLAAYRSAGVAARRVLLAGVGEAAPRDVRQAVAAAVAALRNGSTKSVCICFAGAAQSAGGAAAAAAVAAAADASYVYVATKSKPEPRKLERVVIGVADAHEPALRARFERAVGIVAGVELAKEWANRPANHATPTLLADAAQQLAKSAKFDCEVLGPKEAAKLGMGAFLAVAQGSAEPLRFIVLKYRGAAKAQPPVVLVGKGITFDTGGISIKPAAEMDEMKFDMSGAASVLGTFRALAEIKPAINVVGLIAACENMPGGAAIKPGDVVTGMSGQTIEVLNTDAEGRLVLSDALTYAERFTPRAVIDVATLTGACVIALGAVRSGLFSADDALAADLGAAGERSLDPCWRMPLDDEYAEALKSNFADVPNIAGRAAGSVTAAKFLQRFAGKFAWAHLDIAGTAWKSGAAKGATGRPVGLLVEYLLASASQHADAPGESDRDRSGGRRAAKAASAARGAKVMTSKTAPKKAGARG